MSQLMVPPDLNFTFEAIKKATENFKHRIGKGGYGGVYKGELLISGKLTTVAVKRLDKRLGQGSKEFLMEIELLHGQKHPNLISLLGFCDEGEEKIIVYEYVERGSLDKYIPHTNATYSLTWLQRLGICIDMARGLDHLHNHVGKHQTIIHRDIKSSNILLDYNWVAIISDLGLSKLTLSGLNKSAVISHACGTHGYCEPEYVASGIVTKASDVYSFGIVLLEILCGRLCTVKDEYGLLLLQHYEKDSLDDIIDPSLRQQMSSNSKNKYLSIVDGCLHKERKQRYSMNFVVKGLEETLKSQITNDRKESGLISADDLQGWSSNSSFSTLLTVRTNVGKVFDRFDQNRDGGLSKKELADFLLFSNFKLKYAKEHIDTYVDDFLCSYDKYVDGKKGLTFHGLLEYYNDDHGDLDFDIVRLLSDSDSNNDDSSRRQNSKRNVQKCSSDKDDGLIRELRAVYKNLAEKIGGLRNKVSHWVSLRDTFVTYKSVIVEISTLLFPLFCLATLILLITMILVKLSYMWFLFVMLANVDIDAFKTRGRWNGF